MSSPPSIPSPATPTRPHTPTGTASRPTWPTSTTPAWSPTATSRPATPPTPRWPPTSSTMSRREPKCWATLPTAPASSATTWPPRPRPRSSSYRRRDRQCRAGSPSTTSSRRGRRLGHLPGGDHRGAQPPPPGQLGANCTTCPLRLRCTTANAGRVIVLHPHHRHLAAARVQADTDDFDVVYRRWRPMVRAQPGLADPGHQPPSALQRCRAQPAVVVPPLRCHQPATPAHPGPRPRTRWDLDDTRGRVDACRY